MIVRLCVAALLLMPSAAFAQGNPGNPGPFGGLFGRHPERTGGEFTAVDFRNSWAAQYDDAVFEDESLGPDEVPQSGYTAGVNAGLVFERQSDRLRFLAQGGATYQEFYRQPTFGATTYDGAVRFNARPMTRLEIDAQAQYMRSPFYRLGPGNSIASPIVVPGDVNIVRTLTNDSYQLGGGFTSRYSKSSTLQFHAFQRQTHFAGSPGAAFDVVGVQGRWRRQLNRSLGVHAAYGQERIKQELTPASKYTYEIIDIGIDVNRQFSVWRRTSIDMTAETAAVRKPTTGRSYRLNGRASITKHFAKTWRASAGYSRNTEFVPGFIEPLFTDGVNGMIGGMLSPRSEWTTTVSANKGNFGFDDDSPYATVQTTARLSWALTRRLGIYGQYALYHYDVPRSAAAFPVPSQVSRQAFTVGFNTWIPIFNKVRAPRDPE